MPHRTRSNNNFVQYSPPYLAKKVMFYYQTSNVFFIKPRPNDCNISTQHNYRCWVQHVACIWPPCGDMLGVVGSNLKMVKFSMQHLWMLHDAVVVWPGSCNNVARGHAH